MRHSLDFCRVTRRSGENLGPRRSLICSIGDVVARFRKASDLRRTHLRPRAQHRWKALELSFLTVLGSMQEMLGLQNGKSLKHAKKQQNLDFFRIFAEFSRKFARKVHEEPHRLGLRFFFYTIANVFRRFQVARDSFSLEKPRKLRSRFSKFRIFALIVLLRLEANFEFQKCAVTSPTFLTYRV